MPKYTVTVRPGAPIYADATFKELTKLASLADAWGLSVDRFFMERVEG